MDRYTIMLIIGIVSVIVLVAWFDNWFGYHCEETFDEIMDTYTGKQYGYYAYENITPMGGVRNLSSFVVDWLAEKENELLENSCFINVEQWAYKSKYEQKALEWQTTQP